MKKKVKFSIPSKYILLAVSVLCIALIAVSIRTGFSGESLKTVTGYVFVPFQKGLNQFGSLFYEKAESAKNLKEANAQNVELQKQIDELLVENNALQQDKYELQRLRELYELDQQYEGYSKVAARVIGKDPGNWFDVFMIDKGTDDGLALDNNVLAGGGLVGIIVDIGPNWATIRTIIDDSRNVSGKNLETSDRCIVSGDLKLINEGMIHFSQMTDSDNKVSVGDKIVTSSISSKYLPGILIGYISEVRLDSNNLTKSGYVTPVVDFQHLEEVLVITNLKTEK